MAHAANTTRPLQREISPPEAPDSFYPGFNPSIQVLPKGHKRYPRSRPFPVATIYERDAGIPMRDGTILRADIFRPEDSKTVPAILPWSPYGKSGAGEWYPSPKWFQDQFLTNLQVPQDWK
jgi:predicted acyl esterase